VIQHATLFTALLLVARDVYAEPIDIGLLEGIAPYARTQGDRLDGPLIDILRDSFSRIGLTPEFRPMSYARSIASLNNNSVQAAITVDINGRPSGLTDPGGCSSYPLAVSSWGAYGKLEANNPLYRGQYQHVQVGSYRFVDMAFLPESIASAPVNFRSNELMYRALLSGRVDVVLTDDGTIRFWRERSNHQVNKIESFGTVRMKICFSSDFVANNDDIVKRYSQAARYLVMDGSVARVLEKRNLTWLSDVLIDNLLLD